MLPLKELSPTDLLAIEVPEECYSFYISGAGFLCAYKPRKAVVTSIKLIGCNYEILGEVTSDNISFDVEPYYFPVNVLSKKASFYSLLIAHGFYFKNPFNKEDFDLRYLTDEQIKLIEERDHDWQSFENKLVKKVLILKITT